MTHLHQRPIKDNVITFFLTQFITIKMNVDYKPLIRNQLIDF